MACWGGNYYGQVAGAPAGTFSALAAGLYHNCALSAGAITCWGRSDEGQLTPPALPDGVTFVSVSAGNYHACGLGSDKKVYCWGPVWGVGTVPGDDFDAVAAGGEHTCGLKPDHTVTCWGANASGQVSPAPTGAFAQLEMGASHSCGVLSADNSVVCWGNNANNQSTPVAAGTYASVSGGGGHTCAVTTQGGIACWGTSSGTIP